MNHHSITRFFHAAALSSLLPLSRAQTLEVLHSFQGSDGANPWWSPLLQASDGNFYGTTFQGGDPAVGRNGFGLGTVFKMTPEGVLTTLVIFEGPNGAYPTGGLIEGADGYLYGTTNEGGDLSLSDGTGGGTIFKMTRDGDLTTLVQFSGANGLGPGGELVQDKGGNIFGLTGAGSGNTQYGSIFQLKPDGSLITLHGFESQSGGVGPDQGLLWGSDGDLYGATFWGGSEGDGTIFKMSPAGAFTTLASFHGADGAQPYSRLVQDADGNLYGTTSAGGPDSKSGCGTVFKFGSNGALTALFNFSSGSGCSPWAGLIRASDGDFYGTTRSGGLNEAGTVFRLKANGTLTTLASFTGANGEWPEASLMQGKDGHLYGTTYTGGNPSAPKGGLGFGTIFRIRMPIPSVLPPLKVIRAGDVILVSWPASVSGVALEEQETLLAGDWKAVSIAATVVGEEQVVTLAMTGSARFFRLRQEP